MVWKLSPQKSFPHTLCANVFEQFSYNQAFTPKMPCNCIFCARVLPFLYHTEKNLQATLPLSWLLNVNLASDWLVFTLGYGAFCFWPTPLVWNERIEDLLHSKYGGSQSAPSWHHQDHPYFKQCCPFREGLIGTQPCVERRFKCYMLEG